MRSLAGAADDQAIMQEPLADRALASARQMLIEGEVAKAQRQLETMIARFPETAAAAAARRLLVGLYTAPATAPGAGAVAATNTAQPQPPLRRMISNLDLAAVRTRQDEFRLSVGDRIFFPERSFELGARARLVLSSQAQWLTAHPEFRITVEGHADDLTTAAEANRIAAARADAVRARLIEEGVAEHRIEVRSMGDRNPISTCREPACAAHNRRVIVVLEAAPSAPSRTGALTVRDAPGQAGSMPPQTGIGREAAR